MELKTGNKVYLKGSMDNTEGRVSGFLDEAVRVKWADGQCGIYRASDLSRDRQRPWSSNPALISPNAYPSQRRND